MFWYALILIRIFLIDGQKPFNTVEKQVLSIFQAKLL